MTYNRAWMRLLDVDPAVLPQITLLDLIYPEDQRSIEAFFRNHQDYRGNLRFVHRDGSWQWVSIQIDWIEDEAAYYVTAQDETSRHEAEISAESARHFAESIVQTVREPLVVLDSRACIQSVNRAFCQTFQTSEAETIGYLLDELGNGQWKIPALHRLLNEVITHNASFEDFEVTHQFPLIGWKTMMLNARQIALEGQGTLMLLAIEDITARKHAEALLEQKVNELVRSNAELEQFAYVASHDLQEPLRMVASYVQLLERRYRGRLDQDADDFIGFAVDGATRMQVLINDLLAYSRVGRQELLLEPVDCAYVLEMTLRNLEVRIEQLQAVITSDPLPTVPGEASLLVRVFQNLISNSLKFHRDVPPQIHISSLRDGAFWRFSVRDNGIGIEPQYWERIFLIFERLHSRAAYPGTGIGLAITKKIVERHGGRIWLTSEFGVGTEFFFTLPAEKAGNSYVTQ